MQRLLFATILLCSAGCFRSSGETWEDFKTAGRYMQKGVDAMWGKDYESRMLTSDDEFLGPDEGEFLPLRETDLRNSFAATDGALPQPRGIPGQKNVPALSDFYAPPDTLRSLFYPVHFATDEYVAKERSEVESLMQLAEYLKKNTKTYLIVEGNCDERASADYNMSLGMRRANYVRSFLVKQGVDLNRIYTVSRGKENPVALGHSSDEWKQNRRCEFKIYQK